MHLILIFWKPALEISILWFVIYHIMLFFEGTRAINVLKGIIVLVLAFLLIQVLSLDNLDWLMTKLLGISVLALLVIFHPEIRQGLARLGQRHLFVPPLRKEDLDFMLQEIARAADSLSKAKLGALIVIEKKNPLTAYIESGVHIDARVSAELVEAVFTPNNPLHDGALVIQHGRIAAAGCLLPLALNQELSRIYGTRHRAALGLSEETDALIVIVSEERGDVSLVYGEKLDKDIKKEELVPKMKEILRQREEND